MNLRRAAAHLSYLARRHWANRAAYARFSDWVCSIYSDAVDLAPWPLPGHGRTRHVQCAGLGRPVQLRMGTADWFTFEELFLQGEYQPMVNHFAAPPRNILDVGVNIGLSVALWQKTWPGVNVIGVEPDPDNLHLAAANALEPARFHQACVGGTARRAFLNRSTNAAAFFLSDRSSPGAIAIQVVTVQELLPADGAEIELMKCDVEGAEAEIFKDCAPWIGRIGHLVIEIHPPYSRAQLLADLAAAGSRLALFHSRQKSGVEVLSFCGAGCSTPDHSNHTPALS